MTHPNPNRRLATELTYGSSGISATKMRDSIQLPAYFHYEGLSKVIHVIVPVHCGYPMDQRGADSDVPRRLQRQNVVMYIMLSMLQIYKKPS